MLTKPIVIEKPHEGQIYLIANAKRFNVVCCGRRFGKTVFAKRRLAKRGYEQGLHVAYFAPTYKMLSEVWRQMNALLAPVIVKRNVQEKRLELLTGGIIDFWSLDNIDSARGRAYHEIVVDECAVIADLLHAWETSLRPLLTDYQGKAWFLSTPKGFASDFYTLFQYGQEFENWQSFQMPTSTNPRISKSELQQVKAQLPDYAYRQEYDAEFVVYQGMLFASDFSREKHITPDYNYIEYKEVFLSFDFNIINSCLVVQHGHNNEINVLKEYRERDLQQMCDEIMQDFPTSRYYINGDASGSSHSATSLLTAYQMIVGFLGLSFDFDFKVQTKNPSLVDSRNQVNYILKNHPVHIYKECKSLIADMEAVQSDEKGGIDQKQKRNQAGIGHILDCFRYYCFANHYMETYRKT